MTAKTIKYIKSNEGMDRLLETTKRIFSGCGMCQKTKVISTKTKVETKQLHVNEV